MLVESYNTIYDILLTAYKGDYAILVFLFCYPYNLNVDGLLAQFNTIIC